MFRYICAWLQALFGYVKVWLPAAMEDGPDDSAWLGAAPAMEEDPVTVSLGPTGPLFQQLHSVIASLQDSRRLKLKGLKPEIQILGRELEGFCIDLKDLSEAPDKASTRCWMRQVRDLCYDTADYLDELMHFIHYSSGARHRRRRSRTRNFGGNRLGSKTFLISRRLTWLSLPKLKTWKRALLIAKLSSLVARVEDADERRQRFNISPPKSIKHDHKEAADVMPQVPIKHDDVDKLIDLMAFHDKKVKVVTIFGSAGAGKTALARTLYHQHRGRFQHRAFIRVSRDPDMRRLLIDMLSQIKAPLPDAFSDAQGLIGSIIKHLQGKRYLIIIDDLWSTSTWDIIVRALPDGDYCRIITTTQVEDVALACCSYELKHIYEITPLNDSQLGISEGDCTAYPSSEAMKEDINLVYNNLPPHLKTCLLYLNMYQEGYTIRKHELVKQWVAEGFIGSVQGQDREDTAGSYFEALISEGMIQPVETSHTGEVLSCTLHHMVLDLIRQKSMDDNFVTIVNYFQTILGLPDKVRRLSVQLGGAKGANNITENMRISQVRSLLFSGFFKRVPSIAEYVLLQVLILHIWSDQDSIFDLTTIGELYRLRYLKIECNITVKLPGKIRRLQHLRSLQVDARLCNVPSDIVYLEKLLHLRLLSECILPPGVGRMTSLRTLGYFDLGQNSEGNVRGLDKLENLQNLQLTCSTVQPADSLEKNMQLLGSVLKKLSSLQSVYLVPATGSSHLQDDAGTSRIYISCDSLCIESPAPTHLERLELSPRCCIFYRLPNWIGKLIKLRILKIAVRELSKEATDILKGIPSLTVLLLHVQHMSAERIVFGKGGFSVLRFFKFTCTVPWLKFEAGAMPNLEMLKLCFNAQIVDEGITPIIIEHLSGLKEISAKISCAGVDAEPVRCKFIKNDPRNPGVQLMGGIYNPPHGPDPAQGHDSNISAGLTSSTRPVIELREAERTLSEQPLMSDKYLVSAATGAMLSLLGKLGTMMSDEYKMLKGVRGDIQFLKNELEALHAFLLHMADVEDPPKQAKLHVNVVRELSYDIEDKIDKFIVLIDHDPSSKSDSFKELFAKSMEKITKINARPRHKMAKDVKDINIKIAEVRERYKRYVMDPSLRPTNEKVDPRLQAIYRDTTKLVGIDGPTNVLVNWLSKQEGESAHHHQLKVVNIVGSGGLGKTTLARQVYNKLGANYDCRAFVSISRNPNMTSILRSILSEISNGTESARESPQQIIDQIRKFLQDKRYFIIIDDIWDKNHWYETLACALVRNDCGSAIMTTTRNIDVAKSCSASDGDLVYELQPLGVDHSKKLFFKRIFGCEEKCPPNLKEASDDILKKCGGLPLAINATSSLLATREPKQEWWDRVRRSIHFAQGEHSEIDAMDYILSLSYFDLPLYLRSCLLYLTMFPEDYKIERQRLVHRWISEGLIHGGDEEDLVELGQKYFHQLVNRSLIQPVGIGYDGQARCCRVHDIVLDFLIRKSAKENFSTLLSSNPKSDCRVRRTFLMGSEDRASVEKLDLSHARSLGAFGDDIKELPSLGKSNALRVLDLCKCYELGNHHVKDIGRLLQLRYLNISETMVMKLPKEIGDLEYLETLNLHMNFQELPESVTRLKRLARLFVGTDAKFPDGIGNMTSLQELGIVDALKQSVMFLEELGKLTNLRHLRIRWVSTSESGEASDKEKALVSSLCKLDKCKLSNLSIEFWLPEDPTFIGRSFPALGSIREIHLGSGWITQWMLSLTNLERLCLFSCQHQMEQQDVEMVGSIPSLLEFTAINELVGSIIISGGFQQLRKFDLYTHTTELTFAAGAMPNLQELLIRWISFELHDSAALTFEVGALPNLKEFTLWIRLDKFASAGAELDFGIQHLTSLDRFGVVIDCAGVQPDALDMEHAEGVFKSMADAHPNRPTLKMMKGYNYLGSPDEE